MTTSRNFMKRRDGVVLRWSIFSLLVLCNILMMVIRRSWTMEQTTILNRVEALAFGGGVLSKTTTTSRSSMKLSELGKKSTALDVLGSLNSSKKLAPYVSSGGIAVVTGGSSGIGVVTVETLALAGMKVVLCAQNITKAQQIIDKMDNSVNTDNIRIQKMDLSDLKSVQMAVDEILSEEGQIDLLLNNAGVMAIPQKELTAQGFEKQIGINHVGHFYLTNKLLSHMREGGRVVTVASTAHAIPKTLMVNDLNFDSSDNKYTPWGAYGQTKLCNILFAKELQDRLEADKKDILSVCLHPGVIKTGLWKYTTGDNPLFNFFANLIADKNVEQGAATNVFCSSMESDGLVGGAYYADCQVGTPNANGKDETKQLRRQLWTKTKEMLTNAGYSTLATATTTTLTTAA